MENKYKRSPRWIPISHGFIWLFVTLLLYSLFGFNLVTFLSTFLPVGLSMSAFGKGLFGSDTLINAMVSSIPLKYLKILESDNLDMDQVLINLEYLE